MAGLPSLVGYLPVGDANADVLAMGPREIFPVAGDTPVIAGVLASTRPGTSGVPRRGESGGIRRCHQLPHGGPDRRNLPALPRAGRAGLRARSRDDRAGAYPRPLHPRLLFLAGGNRPDGKERRRRRHRAPQDDEWGSCRSSESSRASGRLPSRRSRLRRRAPRRSGRPVPRPRRPARHPAGDRAAISPHGAVGFVAASASSGSRPNRR